MGTEPTLACCLNCFFLRFCGRIDPAESTTPSLPAQCRIRSCIAEISQSFPRTLSLLARYCRAVYRSEAMSDTKNDPTKKSEVESNGVTRRDFIKNAAVGGAGFMIVPRHVLGRGMTPPSDLLNIAGVGIGGMGRSNLIALASQNIAALCDVDWDYAGKAFERLSTDIEHLQTRVNQAPAGGQAQSQTRSGLNSSTPEQQLANMKGLYTEHWQTAKRYKDN